MMTKKLVGTIVISFLLTSLLFSQEKAYIEETQGVLEVKAPNGHHIGVFAGTSGGVGFTYRYFKRKVGMQVTALPLFSNDGSAVFVGGELMASIFRSEKINFYSYMGYHLIYDKTITEYDTIKSEYTDINSIGGLGFGIEMFAGRRVSINFQLGLNYYYFDENSWGTRPDVGFGIFYRF